MTTVEIGRVVKPHGVRGELKARLHWAESDVLNEVRSVLVEAPGWEGARRFEIERCRYSPKGALLKLRGIDSVEAAQELRQALLQLPREELPEPGQDEFYLVDLVGAVVLGPNGEVGRVTAVEVHSNLDTIVIVSPEGKRYEQPLREPWVERIDVENREIVLSSLDGLID